MMLRANDRCSRWVFLREFDWLGDTIPPAWVRDLAPWRAVVREELYGANVFIVGNQHVVPQDTKIDIERHRPDRATAYLCGVAGRRLAGRMLRRLNGLPLLAWRRIYHVAPDNRPVYRGLKGGCSAFVDPINDRWEWVAQGFGKGMCFTKREAMLAAERAMGVDL